MLDSTVVCRTGLSVVSGEVLTRTGQVAVAQVEEEEEVGQVGGEPRLPEHPLGSPAPQVGTGEPRLPRVGSRAPPRGAGSRGSPSGSPRELGRRPRGRTGCAGFVHPSHPSSLQKHTFAHLWPGRERGEQIRHSRYGRP